MTKYAFLKSVTVHVKFRN